MMSTAGDTALLEQRDYLFRCIRSCFSYAPRSKEEDKSRVLLEILAKLARCRAPVPGRMTFLRYQPLLIFACVITPRNTNPSTYKCNVWSDWCSSLVLLAG
jgi:hypothetical protein